MSSPVEMVIDSGFFVLQYKNQSPKNHEVKRHVDNTFIQFHFALQESMCLIFNKGNYRLPLQNGHMLLLYNPTQSLSLDIDLPVRGEGLSILISIQKFHSLFSGTNADIDFLKSDNKANKYYKETSISPRIAGVLEQITNTALEPSIKKLYIKGKIYELLSLYFSTSENPNIEQCPFLADKENILKIKKAKEIMLSRMYNPPSLEDLALEIDLSLKKLKEGFKEIYGSSVYGFLLNYKMEQAKALLKSGNYNINEVSEKMGYSNASHFIDAFKKKYGITPRKYNVSKKTPDSAPKTKLTKNIN